jgi:hypothetical protein
LDAVKLSKTVEHSTQIDDIVSQLMELKTLATRKESNCVLNHLFAEYGSPYEPCRVDHFEVKIIRVSATRLYTKYSVRNLVVILHVFTVGAALTPRGICMSVPMLRKKRLPPFSVVTKFGSNGSWSNFYDEMFGLIYISEYPET